MARNQDDDDLPSYGEAVGILKQEMVHKFGLDASTIGPDILRNRPEVVAIFPPKYDDRHSPSEVNQSPLHAQRINDDQSSVAGSSNSWTGHSVNWNRPSEHLPVTSRVCTSALQNPTPERLVPASMNVMGRYHSGTLVVDLQDTTPDAIMDPREQDHTQNDDNPADEIERHPNPTTELQYNPVVDISRSDPNPVSPESTSSGRGSDSDSDAIHGAGITTAETQGQELILLPVELPQNIFRIPYNRTQTNIEWSPPSNVDSFSDVSYRIQLLGKAPRHNLEDECVKNTHECSTTHLRVYRLEDLVIIGRIRLDIAPKKLRLRIRAEGTSVISKDRSQGRTEGQWSNIFYIILQESPRAWRYRIVI